MPKKLNHRTLTRFADKFCRIRHIHDLAKMLDTAPYRLELLAAHPQYNIFSVPKKDGSKRWIEDPVDELQTAQNKLAFYLGLVYYQHKTAAAYGFITTVKKETDPRHIVSNAQQHLGKDYLFNADLEDFFHQVKAARLEKIFSGALFNFNDKLVETLVNLCTNQGRLPMGAPTSPVLSNFATIEMDRELLQVAQWAEWRYTRYADDLCFSSETDFKAAEIDRIIGIVEAEGYTFNKRKFKHLGPNDRKEITGVQLGDGKVEVPDGFLKKLEMEIQKLHHVVEVANRMGRREKWIDRFQQQVAGKVNFVEMVNGSEDVTTHKMQDLLMDANNPPDEFGAMSWLDFGYV